MEPCKKEISRDGHLSLNWNSNNNNTERFNLKKSDTKESRQIFFLNGFN